MTIEHPSEDDVTQLASRVMKARGRLAYQFDPALTEALSEYELKAERELAERIRTQDRDQRWKQAQAIAAASDRARQTTEQIEKADIRDLLLARRAIAAQRRESSPHAKLASLYRHRSWSLRALAGVVAAGMLWSAVNVQHNIAPGGPSDPLYWFSYLLEGMISVCLVIIMTGTNKVAEWGIVDSRRQVAAAEIALLAVTVTLNTYPYLRLEKWYDVGVHAVAPIMIGVALLIHDAASVRYGLAITRATHQVSDLPDPAEQIRRTLTTVNAVRVSSQKELANTQQPADAELSEVPATEAETPAVVADGDDFAADGAITPEYAEVRPLSPTAASGPAQSLDNETTMEFHFNASDFEANKDKGAVNGAASEESANNYAAIVDKALQSIYTPESESERDSGAATVSNTLEQELAELQAARRKARSHK